MASFFGINFKSKEERERDYQNYFNKIFPYGESQKQKVENILGELVNKKEQNELMMHYILIKEAMIDTEEDYETIAKRIEKKRIVKLTPELKECICILINVDLAIDEGLDYPSVEELKAKIGKDTIM